MERHRTYSGYAQEAVLLIGEQVKLERKRRRWTEQSLADRAGISRATLQKIERGGMGCAIGIVFEVSALLGIELFESGSVPLDQQIKQVQGKVSLLPQRIKTTGKKE